MAQFEISVTADYVPGWGLQEAVREILQNAKDEEERDSTHPMRVEFSVRRQTLAITSDNVTLDRAVLLLGETNKRGSHARGQFGEGLPLAILALVRSGYPLRIENGEESWIADLRFSEAWARQVLVVETRRLQNFRPHFRVEVGNVTQDDWIAMVRRTRFLPGADRDDVTISVDEDTVILNRPGDIFVRGLWVAKAPNLSAGYDLSIAELDRDRRLINTWTLTGTLGRIWMNAIEKMPTAITHVSKLIQAGSEDVAGLANTIRYGSDTSAVKTAVAADFAARHGADAIPVTSTTDADTAKAAGLAPVIVSRQEKEIVEAATGRSLLDAVASAGKRVVRSYGPDDLQDVATRWKFICEMATLITAPSAPPPMTVVDFGSTDTLGIYHEGEIQIARKLIDAPGPGPALVTLCHEVAHSISGRHGYDHGAAAESALEHVVDHLACWPSE